MGYVRVLWKFDEALPKTDRRGFTFSDRSDRPNPPDLRSPKSRLLHQLRRRDIGAS
jgi:hypothetical protein